MVSDAVVSISGMNIIIWHIMALLCSILDLDFLNSLFNFLLSLFIDHQESLFDIVASILVGFDHLLKVIVSIRVRIDDLHHSSVDFNIL